MTESSDGDQVEVVLLLDRSGDGRVSVHLRRTTPPTDYGTVELADLPVLLEAVLTAGDEEGL